MNPFRALKQWLFAPHIEEAGPDSMVTITTLPDGRRARFVVEHLKAENIPASVHPDPELWISSEALLARSGYRVSVLGKDLERARELMSSGDLETPDVVWPGTRSPDDDG